MTIEEIEDVVLRAKPPYPQSAGEKKLRVMGRGRGNRLIQVIYVNDSDNSAYVIHARPLNPGNETRAYRRRER